MAFLLRRVNTYYSASFARRPMLTLCITNASLGIISDLLAQSITYVDYKRSIGSRPSSPPDLEGMLPERLQENEELKPRPPQFNPWRTARFAVYGFCIAPVVGRWFQLLDRRFPLPAAASSKSAIVATLRRVAVDQAIFAPVGIALFFTAMGFMEGNGAQGVGEKFRDAYLPAFIANYKVWPLVQFVNFRFCPLPYRVPFVSTVGIFWNGYLSYLNNAAKEQEEVQLHLQHEKVDMIEGHREIALKG